MAKSIQTFIGEYMKIGFTGTRKGMTTLQIKQLEYILDFYPEITELHHGGCIGADKQIHDIVQKDFSNISIHIHPCNITDKRAFCVQRDKDVIYPEKDPLERNHNIVDACDVLLATPKERNEVLRSGTWATIRYAIKLNKNVRIL